MKKYTLCFDFTTVRGSRFSGHSGELDVQPDGEVTIEALWKDQKGLEAQIGSYLTHKVKDTLFMVTLRDIKEIKEA
jgi:hypothetical protein